MKQAGHALSRAAWDVVAPAIVQHTSASSRLAAAGAFAAYTATILAFAYAAVSLYWTLGGRLLLATVGGFTEDIAPRAA